MIKPTRGRVVLFTPAKSDQLMSGDEPLAAIIAHVHSDTVLNLAVFDAFGRVHARPSVELVQEGKKTDPGTAFAEWMPYQKGQAAKTEQIEQKLNTLAPASTLAPHQQRVVDEKAELDGRHSKLIAFFATPTFSGLHAEERDRLADQERAMREYSRILGDRIAAFA